MDIYIYIYNFIIRYTDKLQNFSSDKLLMYYNQSSSMIQSILSCSTTPRNAHGFLTH